MKLKEKPRNTLENITIKREKVFRILKTKKTSLKKLDVAKLRKNRETCS